MTPEERTVDALLIPPRRTLSTKGAAERYNVSTAIILYVARRDGLGERIKKGRRFVWRFSIEELDPIFRD